jgi:hypothetical protein
MALDKSFAQTVKRGQLSELSQSHVLLVPTAFYYEVFDNDAEQRRCTVSGLDEFRRVDIPTFLREETLTGRPALTGDLPRFYFNPEVMSDGWEMRPDHRSSMVQHESHIITPSLEFWNEVILRGVIGFTPAEHQTLRGTDEEFEAVCTSLRRIDKIREIAALMGYPHAAKIDPTWFHFRHFQAMLLQGLVLYRRHQDANAPRNMTKMEHDLHDLDYLTLGLLTGSLATAETSSQPRKASMAWRFKLIEPDGHLLTPAALVA